MSKSESNWFVYILRCADDTLYTGITTNLNRRIDEHNNDDTKAARYTTSRRPVELVFHRPFANRALASQREYEIKQLNREQKLDLIDKQQTQSAS